MLIMVTHGFQEQGIWKIKRILSLQWRHNELDGVTHHRRLGCLLDRLFRRRSKKTSQLRVTVLCEGNSPVNGEFPAQKASNAEKRFHFLTSSCQIDTAMYSSYTAQGIMLSFHGKQMCRVWSIDHKINIHQNGNYDPGIPAIRNMFTIPLTMGPVCCFIYFKSKFTKFCKRK